MGFPRDLREETAGKLVVAFAAMDTQDYRDYYCRAEGELPQVWRHSLQLLGSMGSSVPEAGAEGPLQPAGRVAAVVVRKTGVYHRLLELGSAMDMSAASEMPSFASMAGVTVEI